MTDTRLGVLISGRGSNMQAIVRACDAGLVPATVQVVISNRRSAPGLGWAAAHGLKTAVLPSRAYPSREAHDATVVSVLRGEGVEWVCLAGYMRLLSHVFLESFPNRILNIHPSLLPAFPGLHAQEQAFAWGVKVAGCTVHLVDIELDHGPIVVQRSVAVGDAADAETLASRILELEHDAYPEALRRLLSEDWCIDERRVCWLGHQHEMPGRNHSR